MCVCVWIWNYKKSDSINKRGESALDAVKLSAPVDGAGDGNKWAHFQHPRSYLWLILSLCETATETSAGLHFHGVILVFSSDPDLISDLGAFKCVPRNINSHKNTNKVFFHVSYTLTISFLLMWLNVVNEWMNGRMGACWGSERDLIAEQRSHCASFNPACM